MSDVYSEHIEKLMAVRPEDFQNNTYREWVSGRGIFKYVRGGQGCLTQIKSDNSEEMWRAPNEEFHKEGRSP